MRGALLAACAVIVIVCLFVCLSQREKTTDCTKPINHSYCYGS